MKLHSKKSIVFVVILVTCHLLVMSVLSDAAKPNFVFIMADDLGWADVGFHGGNAPTPHLDRLASEGLELAAHYVAPVCSPTRAGLMTGRYWSRFGLTAPTNTRALPWETVTLPRALKSVGYDTCLTGKWHLGSVPDEGPNHFGFDHSYGSLAGGVTSWQHRYKSGPFSITWHRNEQLIEDEGHVTDLITDEAIAWLKQRGDTPFFLYMPYTAVHLPVDEPDKWLQQVPASITGEVARHYAASIMHLDDSVGRILQTLDDIGKRENTLVIFTSDNGGSTAENRDTKYPNNNAPQGRLTGNNFPLRGQKGSVHEGGTRVPTIASWPSRLKPGRVDAPIQIVDWMATFCSLAGYVANAELNWDGTDLTKLLTQHQPPAPRSLYIVGPGWRAMALRHGDWKLVVHGQKQEAKTELFQIREDPAESTDLSASLPERVQQLRAKLEAISQADNDAKVTGDK